MIRILLVPSSDYIGHPFPQRHNHIFERLNDGRKFEVHVVRFKLFEGQNLRTGLRVHELNGSARHGIASYYLTNMLKHAGQIRNIVKDEKIDLIVLSNLAAPFVYVVLDELSSRRVSSIVDLPDYFPSSATGYMSEFGGARSVISEIFDLMLRRVMHRSNAVTAASTTLLGYVNQCGVRDVFYVPNGIDDAFLTVHDGRPFRRDLDLIDSDLVVGYVGSIDFWLDLRTFLRSLSITRKTGLNLKCLLVGKGLHRQLYSEKLTRWIIEEGLEDAVIRLDFIQHKNVPEFMASLDVGTIPFDTRNLTAYYSAPMKMWEYLSQMKPVVSTPIPEAINNADSVLLASRVEDYVSHFRAVHSGAESVVQKVKVGHEKACRLTWRAAAQSFADACIKVLERRC